MKAGERRIPKDDPVPEAKKPKKAQASHSEGASGSGQKKAETGGGEKKKKITRDRRLHCSTFSAHLARFVLLQPLSLHSTKVLQTCASLHFFISLLQGRVVRDLGGKGCSP
eukprot:2261174-Amphidinium_carterae.3